jgi:hypothetical protein
MNIAKTLINVGGTILKTVKWCRYVMGSHLPWPHQWIAHLNSVDLTSTKFFLYKVVYGYFSLDNSLCQLDGLIWYAWMYIGPWCWVASWSWDCQSCLGISRRHENGKESLFSISYFRIAKVAMLLVTVLRMRSAKRCQVARRTELARLTRPRVLLLTQCCWPQPQAEGYVPTRLEGPFSVHEDMLIRVSRTVLDGNCGALQKISKLTHIFSITSSTSLYLGDVACVGQCLKGPRIFIVSLTFSIWRWAWHLVMLVRWSINWLLPHVIT